MSLRTILCLACLALFAILTLAFFALEANTLMEFADSFYIFDTSVFLFSVYLTFSLKSEKIFAMISSCETEIERRKLVR